MKTTNFLEKYTEKPTSVFKRLFVTFSFGYLPFMLLHIIFNLTGTIPVNFNNEQIYGPVAILVIICFAPFMVFAFTLLTYFGLMCGYLILKGLKIIFNNDKKGVDNNSRMADGSVNK